MLDSTLADRLELWGFDNNVMVFRDFSLGGALKLSSIDVSCKSDEAINELKSQIRQFLNGLDSNLSLQFVQEIVPEMPVRLASMQTVFLKKPLLSFRRSQIRESKASQHSMREDCYRNKISIFSSENLSRKLRRLDSFVALIRN